MPRRRSNGTFRTLLLIALLLVILVVAFVVTRQQPGFVPPAGGDSLQITIVDVEQGDAILIQLGETDLLVDAGPRGACDHLLTSLTGVRGELELLAITHPHDDHYGCAPEVLERHRVQRLVTNGERRGPPRDKKPLVSWTRFEEAAARAMLPLESLQVGEALTPAPRLTLKVLASRNPEGGRFRDSESGEDINNDSLVLLLDFAGRKVLLTGDIEVAGGRHLVKQYCAGSWGCAPLQADVLKVPHHGSEDFAPEFFRAVQPSWAVISANYGSRKHFLPRAKTVRALQEVGAKVLSTSAEGTEDVRLTISPSGELSWRAPGAPVFVWDEKREAYFAQ